MQLQESGEMYLETIYVLSKTNNYVRSIDVGERMGYSKPSVSRAVGLLKNGGYITVDREGYISLTSMWEESSQRQRGVWELRVQLQAHRAWMPRCFLPRLLPLLLQRRRVP